MKLLVIFVFAIVMVTSAQEDSGELFRRSIPRKSLHNTGIPRHSVHSDDKWNTSDMDDDFDLENHQSSKKKLPELPSRRSLTPLKVAARASKVVSKSSSIIEAIFPTLRAIWPEIMKRAQGTMWEMPAKVVLDTIDAMIKSYGKNSAGKDSAGKDSKSAA